LNLIEKLTIVLITGIVAVGKSKEAKASVKDGLIQKFKPTHRKWKLKVFGLQFTTAGGK